MTRVMEVFRPGAVVLQCGADSLANDRLGCFSLSLDGHADAVKFMKTFGVPMLVTGGGGYIKVTFDVREMPAWGWQGRFVKSLACSSLLHCGSESTNVALAISLQGVVKLPPLTLPHLPCASQSNVARCWAYETAALLDRPIDEHLPRNDYYEYYAPTYRMHVPPPYVIPNANTRDRLDQVRGRDGARDRGGKKTMQMHQQHSCMPWCDLVCSIACPIATISDPALHHTFVCCTPSDTPGGDGEPASHPVRPVRANARGAARLVHPRRGVRGGGGHEDAGRRDVGGGIAHDIWPGLHQHACASVAQ